VTASAQAIVAGAGPAGAVSALLLARAGIDVVILERAQFPRDKPCGDCLSAAAGGLLARLGLLPAIEALEPARLQGWRILGPNGTGFSAAFTAPGRADPSAAGGAFALPRAAFDLALLQAAAAAGARVLNGARVEDLIFEDGVVRGVRARRAGKLIELRAPITVGADGLRSRVSRRAGLRGRPARRRKLSLTAHLELDTPLPAWGEMHVGDGLCVGIAPVNAAGTLGNVTLVVADRFAPAVRRSARDFFTGALQRFPALPPSVRGHRPDRLLASGPFDLPTRSVIAPGVALVGDAAGYFDPFTGQGIHHAMAGAELLAAVVVPALACGHAITTDALAPYARAHHRLVAGPRRVQRLIERVLAEPGRAEHILRRIAARPDVAQALLDVTGDLRPARALLSPGLLFSFLLPHPQVA
jgi:flavin-dependent dehydrogenase